MKDISDDLGPGHPSPGPGIRPQTSGKRSVAYIRADKKLHGTSDSDTLWIKARDYGMYCEVTSELIASGSKKAYVSGHTTLFNEKSFAITVPRDEDGYAAYNNGFSQGDYMADYWEDSSDTEKIKWMLPFWNDTLARVDGDSVPKGRGFLGDSLTNWEEYRGIRVFDSLRIVADTTRNHVRTHPFRKTVVFQVDRRARPEAKSAFPAYVSLLKDTMGGFEFFRQGELPEFFLALSTGSIWHSVDTNIVGGGSLYPPFGDFRTIGLSWPSSPSTRSFRGNTIVLWGRDRAGWPDSAVVDTGGFVRFTLGLTRGFPVYSDSIGNQGFIPTASAGFTVCVGSINAFGSMNHYYQTRDSIWAVDKKKLTELSLSHEFGHCVGLLHRPLTSSGIMNSPRTNLQLRFQFPVANYDTVSQSQSTISRRDLNP